MTPHPDGSASTGLLRGSTHFIVLAAGTGTRLQQSGVTTPKWLLTVGGEPIASRQLKAIEMAGRGCLNTQTVTVVTGYRHRMVDEFVRSAPQQVDTVYNPQHTSRNNWYSLLLGLRRVPRVTEQDRVVVVNGDLCASSDWLAEAFRTPVHDRSDAALLVDLARPLTEESMKVSVRCDGTDTVVTGIGKTQVTNAIGEYVGVLVLGCGARSRVQSVLEGFVGDDARVQEWYEGAVRETALSCDVRWRVVATPSSEWVEVDDAADVRSAEGLATRW